MSITIYNYLINLSPAYFGQIEFTTNEERGLFSLLWGKGTRRLSEPFKNRTLMWRGGKGGMGNICEQ